MTRRPASQMQDLSRLAARAHRRAVRRRRLRRGLIALLALLAIGVGVAYYARGPLTRGVALATIERALGYEATAGAASLVTRSTVRLPNLTLRAPGVPGEAGVVLEAQRVDLEVDWLLAAVRPADAVRSIALVSPTARVGIDVETGELNLSARRATGGDGAFPEELPPISVEDATLVFGEHGHEAGEPWFSPLHRIRVTGVLAPPEAGSEVYALRLTEEVNGARSPAVLEGELDLRRGAGAFALTAVDFGALRAAGASPPVITPLRRLSVEGRLPIATLEFSPDGAYLARLDLAGVDVGVPAPVLNPEAAGGDQTRPLELTGVTGEVLVDRSGVSANLIGLFGDIDARVLVEIDGFDASADLSAEFITSDYTLGPSPALLPYAPQLAAEFLQRFSGPEAKVSGRVRLDRTGGKTTATGLFAWSEGSAAFEGFPYPITNISGKLSFDGDGIYARDLVAEGPTGATITAEIAASPIGEDAEIDADILATGVPVDEHLLGAIEGDRGEAIAALFDASSLPEETRALLPADYDAGGEVRLEIVVTKRGGEEGEWNWDVLATSPALEIAPAMIGYPATAKNFELRFDRFDATAQLPELIGPTGARGSATVDLQLKDETGASAFRPSVMFNLERAPIDRTLIAALRERASAVADWIERLGVRGEFSASGEASSIGERRAVRVRAPFQGVSFMAGGERVANLDGELTLEDDRLSARAGGRAFGGDVTAEADAQLERELWSADATVEGLEVSRNVAAFLELINEGAGARARELLEEWRPEGAVDLRVAAASASGETEWSAAISNLGGLSAEVGGERIALERAEGAVILDGSSGLARFDAVSAAANVGGDAPLRVRASGEAALASDASGSLKIDAADLPFDSPVVRRLATTFGGDRVTRLLEEADPAGEGDLSVEIESRPNERPIVRGSVRPSRLAINRNDARLSFDSVQGELRFGESDADASLLGFLVESPAWRAMLTGEFRAGEFAGEIDLRAGAVTPDLLAAMPDEAAAIVRRLEFALAEGGAAWIQGTTDESGGASFRIGFENASLRIGAPIEEADGFLTLHRAAEEAPLEGELELERFEAAGAPMRDGRATLVWGAERDTLDVPRIEAMCGGGAIRGRARLAPVEGLSPTSEYLLDLRCSGVPLAWFIERPENPAEASLDDLAQRGLISGRLTVRGGLGEGSPGRVGRGAFAIRGGQVLRLPLLTPALELLNLQPPVGEQLDDAAIEFGLVGDRLVFDRLYVQSKSIVVSAEGEANLADRSLDLWVRSRGRQVVPVLSEIVNALRDELVATRVTGPITDPNYEAVQLPNTRRLLLGAVAPGAGGKSTPTPAPARPAMVESVPLRPEPINE